VRRRAPRPLAVALEGALAQLEPASTTASAQTAWSEAVGEAVAAHARVVGERGGVLEVACDEAVWAAEIELMGPELIERLSAVAGDLGLRAVRCRTLPPESPEYA